MSSRLVWLAMLSLAASACASTAVLEEESPVLVTARPPAPPEPEPEPERVEVKEEKIEVNEKIHFEFDSAKIREESYDLLAEIGQVINDHPEIVKIRVEGHTDSKGTREYNLDLSKRRARAVKDHLVEENGVDPARLEVEGYGLDQPIATNDTDEGRAQNRRVEFTILERDEEAEAPDEPAEPEEAEEPAAEPEEPEEPEQPEESAEGEEEPAGGDSDEDQGGEE